MCKFSFNYISNVFLPAGINQQQRMNERRKRVNTEKNHREIDENK